GHIFKVDAWNCIGHFLRGCFIVGLGGNVDEVGSALLLRQDGNRSIRDSRGGKGLRQHLFALEYSKLGLNLMSYVRREQVAHGVVGAKLADVVGFALDQYPRPSAEE